MRRPQSAKPGYKGYWGQASESDLQQNDNMSKGNHRKNVKLMKPDLTTNDFARILPKKIYQDKERLYSQVLQLKQNLNETLEENIRFKTRITILQKEKDKLTKHIEVGGQSNSMNKVNSRANIYNPKGNQKDNMMIRNLKKMVRQGKQENQFLKQQNAKIKKAIKYTKINELEIQRKILQQQNKKFATLLEDMNNQLSRQDTYEDEILQLKRRLHQSEEERMQLKEQSDKEMQYIQELQEKIGVETEKYLNKQNKLQRDLALNKRKMNEAIKQADDLRKELNILKQQGAIKADNKKVKLTRPVSSNPYKSQGGLVGVRVITQNKKQQGNKQNQQQAKNIKLQNELLKQELLRTKSKLQETQRNLKEQQLKIEPSQSNLNTQAFKKGAVTKAAPEKQKQRDTKAEQIKKNNYLKEENSIKGSNKQQSSTKKGKNNYEQDYENEFDNQKSYDEKFQNNEPQSDNKSQDVSKRDKIASKQEKKKPKEDKEKLPQKNQRQNSQIDQYRKDFEGEDEEQQLFAKDQSPNKKVKPAKNEKDQKGKKKKDSKSTGTFKPDKKILSQIKQLLTYRMKAQRYPYEQLKRDIQQAKQKQFTMTDLQSMFISEPFYLMQKYSDALISYCFEKENSKPSQKITKPALLAKLKKVIDNFELIEEKQQEQMLLRIAEMVTEYPQQLEQAFEKIKNGEQTVAKQDLITMFQNLELEMKYIEVIIQELSLCSNDLAHLNYMGFFQRFYVQNMAGLQNGQIDQQQMQSSSQQVSKNLKPKDSKKFKQIKRQFEDYQDDDIVADDGERLSLGNKDNKQIDDAEIVSDDGPV